VPRIGEEEAEVARAGGRDVAQAIRDEEQVPALQDELLDPGRLGLLRRIGVAEQLGRIGEAVRPIAR
jgi:hypothetical protein